MKRDIQPITKKPNDLPLEVVTDVSPHVARVERLMRAIWARIPKEDQSLMLKAIAMYPEEKLEVQIINEWKHSVGSNAQIRLNHGVIQIDGGYVHAADDRHISSTLAHEFGHLRGHADPNGPDWSEETANHFLQEVWGFPHGEVIFKCEVCRGMETILQKEGITGEILWYAESSCFLYLAPTERLDLTKSNGALLDNHPWTSVKQLLLGDVDDVEDSSSEARRQNARHLKRTTRYKQWEEALTNMAREYLPDEEE